MQGVYSQEPQGFWRGLWQALCGLYFITAFFGWFFMLLSRLAEPLMSLSAIYIIICAGIPQWEAPGLYDVGVAVMIAAPEVILPGAFVLAGQYSERQDTRARMLYWVAWLFVVLTFFTLADLFIFHLEGNALNALMWGRCAVGIAYSILLRVLTHDGHPQPTHTSAPALDYQEIARQLKALFPQPGPAPQVDYREIARQLVPLMPTPQVDYQAIKEQLEAPFKAAFIREITASGATLAGVENGAGASLQGQSQRHLLALGPAVSATRQRRFAAPGGGAGATRQRQPGPPPGATEERLLLAYQELVAESGRVSGRALAARARCNRASATEWLQRHGDDARVESEPSDGATFERPSEPIPESA